MRWIRGIKQKDCKYSFIYDHGDVFFCGCDVCIFFEKLCITESQAKVLLIGLQTCYIGGIYNKTAQESLSDAIQNMNEFKIEEDR